MDTFKTCGEVWAEFLRHRENLETKIKSGEIQDGDLMRAVIIARNEYISKVQDAMFGDSLGHEFDIEDELYKVRALITGEPL